jgi:glycosyltransferase involved in cell wall biosynthesis
MFRIGFDAKRLFNNFTGLGNYSRMLVKGFKAQYPEHEYFLFSPRIRHSAEAASFLTDDFTRISPRHVPGWFWRSVSMKRDITEAGLDIYHGLSNELPLGIAASNTPSVVTIHDLIFRFFPEDYPWIDRQVYEAKFRYACSSARRIIAVSQSTKNDLMAEYGVSGDKIAVVYQACDDRFRQKVGDRDMAAVLSRYALPETYLLYVGTINRRKNLLALVQAMHQTSDAVSLPLVVVGNGKAYKKEVQKFIHEKGLEDRVRFVSQVVAADLPAIYQKSKVAVFPSRYEGFGLPVVEALASGVPVITTRSSSLPEAAGPGAYYADPDDPRSIAEGIVKVLGSPEYARQLIDEGHRHVLRFNPQDTARQLMAVYEEVMKTA